MSVLFAAGGEMKWWEMYMMIKCIFSFSKKIELASHMPRYTYIHTGLISQISRKKRCLEVVLPLNQCASHFLPKNSSRTNFVFKKGIFSKDSVASAKRHERSSSLKLTRNTRNIQNLFPLKSESFDCESIIFRDSFVALKSNNKKSNWCINSGFLPSHDGWTDGRMHEKVSKESKRRMDRTSQI